MLVLNTTYHVDAGQERLFLTWVTEYVLPEEEKLGLLRRPRVCRVLGQAADGQGTSYCVQLEAADTATVHRWWRALGHRREEEMRRVFGEKVVGFSTLMEVVE